MKGANFKELKVLLEKYSKVEDHVPNPKCCCCIPLHVAMIIIGVFVAWELGYNTWYSVHLHSNDGSEAGIIIWFMLKLATAASFVQLLFMRKSEKARKITFLTYTITWVLEMILVVLWFLIAWYSAEYYCVSAVNKCTPDGLCQSCYLLMYPIFYLTLGIPFKIWFSCVTYRYWKSACSTREIRQSLLRVESSSGKHPYHAYESQMNNTTSD